MNSDFETELMKQINITTDKIDFPMEFLEWDKGKGDTKTEYIVVNPSSPEYQRVINKFIQTFGGSQPTILKLEWIQNKHHYNLYQL